MGIDGRTYGAYAKFPCGLRAKVEYALGLAASLLAVIVGSSELTGFKSFASLPVAVLALVVAIQASKKNIGEG
jgi:hypothetical protein